MSGQTENKEKQSPKRQGFFTWTEPKTFTSRDVFNGMLGNLPLLVVVSSGFSRTSSETGVNHLEQFGTGQVLFAFQRAFHRRVLLHDSHDRTLSLPLLSSILFRVKDPLNKSEDKVTTLEDVVTTMTLPVRLSFAQKEDLDFIVGCDHRTHEYFGDLTLVSVYLEPFICCLSIRNEDGKVTNKHVALPCRLRRLEISLVEGLEGGSAGHETLKELISSYVEVAKSVSPRQDPFMKELAFISKKIKIKKETDIPDYIDEDTFIDITRKRPRQRQADGQLNAPPTTPRDKEEPQYETLWPCNRESHEYVLPQSDVDEKNRLPAKGNLEGNSQTIQSVAKSQDPVSLSSKDGFRAVLSNSSAEAPPPVPCRPQVASSLRDDTPTTSKAPALPPASHRVPLRSASTEKVHGQAMPRLTGPAQDRSSSFDIEELSVEDVCRRLKDIGLEKHCKKFKKSLIDGKLLKRIELRALGEEFRLSKIEIAKLSAFIDEGHIPR